MATTSLSADNTLFGSKLVTCPRCGYESRFYRVTTLPRAGRAQAVCGSCHGPIETTFSPLSESERRAVLDKLCDAAIAGEHLCLKWSDLKFVNAEKDPDAPCWHEEYLLPFSMHSNEIDALNARLRASIGNERRYTYDSRREIQVRKHSQVLYDGTGEKWTGRREIPSAAILVNAVEESQAYQAATKKAHDDEVRRRGNTQIGCCLGLVVLFFLMLFKGCGII